MFRWIIDDTRALIEDLRRLARRLSSRWQWFRIRSRRRIESAGAELENVRRGAETTTRMCRECRALIPVKARRCPECGEMPGGSVTTGLGRLVQGMAPGVASISAGILTANVALYGLSLVIWTGLQQDLPGPCRGYAWNITLTALGANVPLLVTEGEAWRLVTSVFLHGGILHLLFNCWAMLAVGPLVEELYGARRFVFLYLTTGIFASLVSTLWRTGTVTPGIGASGALFGMIGLAAVWGARRGGNVGQGIRSQMVQWLLYGLIMGFLIPGVDNAAHLGGLISGAGLGTIIGDAPRGVPASSLWEGIAWLFGLTVVASFLLVAINYQGTLDLILRSGC